MTVEPTSAGMSPAAAKPESARDEQQRLSTEAALRLRFRRAGNGEATRILFQATLEHLLERTA